MKSDPHWLVVLDTNIVLDLLVFSDPATVPLRAALDAGRCQWIATRAMRDELARVLHYPQVAKRLAFHGVTPPEVLSRMDALVLRWEAAPPKAPVTCKDADDQIFIDLAVAFKARLLSKDHAVLCMAKRLRALGVQAHSAFSSETV